LRRPRALCGGAGRLILEAEALLSAAPAAESEGVASALMAKVGMEAPLIPLPKGPAYPPLATPLLVVNFLDSELDKLQERARTAALAAGLPSQIRSARQRMLQSEQLLEIQQKELAWKREVLTALAAEDATRLAALRRVGWEAAAAGSLEAASAAHTAAAGPIPPDAASLEGHLKSLRLGIDSDLAELELELGNASVQSRSCQRPVRGQMR